ncbi:MAG: SPOR domain-containing protein [Fidelibacterota bacterium]
MIEEPIYLKFENNLWKVQVGDFPSKILADQMKQKLENLGYKEIWIVKTAIDIKK